MKKNTQKFKQGFSLIEALVSLAIFSLVIVMMSGMFGSFIKNYQTSHNVQMTLEDAQQSINTMMKTIRTSILVSPTGVGTVQTIRVFNYSQPSGSQCIEYSYSGNTLTYGVAAAATTAALCKTATESSMQVSNLNNDPISNAFFYVVPTGTAQGIVTVSMSFKQGSDTIPIQSTVSLRDYQDVSSSGGTTCTYTYGAWGSCQSSTDTETRSLISSSPSGCTGTPVTTQSCVPTYAYQYLSVGPTTYTDGLAAGWCWGDSGMNYTYLTYPRCSCDTGFLQECGTASFSASTGDPINCSDIMVTGGGGFCLSNVFQKVQTN
jgi:prepilin-type N-terminal cleavage/methylation domain-containing protein